MIAEELINDMVPALTMKDDAEKAILWMGELRTNFLPVIEQSQFKGFITEEIIFENNDLEKPISTIKLVGDNCYLNKNRHFYDIIKLFKDFHIDMVAILDDDNSYLGVVTFEDIMNAFSQTSAIQSPGGIIIISINQIDYSLAQIARLIEENNAKILSSYIKNDPLENDKLLLTLKINTSEISRIIKTLERFEYNIIAQFKENPVRIDEKDRLDLLMKFINI
jgi:signal-transduction protein with cAMP-binding, CBS, and nucleotidyltransferase domain